jgi:hypothetical protein
MTENQTTPSIERAGEAIVREEGVLDWDVLSEQMREYPCGLAVAALTAALSDPDDPDWLARTLFMVHARAHHQSERLARMVWRDQYGEANRENWRAVGDGFRTSILGDNQ